MTVKQAKHRQTHMSHTDRAAYYSNPAARKHDEISGASMQKHRHTGTKHTPFWNARNFNGTPSEYMAKKG